MSDASCLTVVYIRVVCVAYGTDSRHAVLSNVSELAAGESQKSHSVLLSHELCHIAGGTNELSALSGVKLDVVDHCTYGDISQRESVAGLDVGICAASYRVAYAELIGSEDISLLAVLVLNESDESGTVRIVFDSLYFRVHTELVSLEVDNSVLSSVSAALMSDGDTSVAVASGMLFESFEKTSLGSDLR